MSKVKVKTVSTADVVLARNIANHMRKVLTKQFDFIVECAPEINFIMTDNDMLLDTIVFESVDGNASIRIDDESGILAIDDANAQLIFEHEGFEELLNMTANDVYELDAKNRQALNVIRRLYHKHWEVNI